MNVSDLAQETNIAELLSDDELITIGKECMDGYMRDELSRAEWLTRSAESLEAAMQILKPKSFPWANCSNVKFPLITIAALNFASKAYPALINGVEIVKQRVVTADPDGTITEKADRVGKHMSYQLLEMMPWEEQTDRALIVASILGVAFKKTIRCNSENVSDLVMPTDLVVNYFARDLASSERVTHLFEMCKNDLYENYMAGIFLEHADNLPSTQPTNDATDASNKIQGKEDTGETTYFMAEQSCFIDLDKDGYKEPYAVTFDRVTGKVYRIHARYFSNDIKYVASGKNKGKIQRIEAENYYTKVPFIPSPDGGFYDIGFGTLLNPINESVNTAINQSFDAATMATLGGGFLGRGIKIKGGESSFKPGEWKQTDSPGEELARNIVPHPSRDPSPVLLQLVQYLVGYAERISGATELESGVLPDNAKTGAVELINQNGQKIFNAIYKRIWRSFKEEFKKLYKLNQIYVTNDGYLDNNQYFEITAEDYSGNPNDICPVADPNIISDSDKLRQALLVASRSETTGMYNSYEVEKRLLKSVTVPAIDQILPDPQGPNAPPPPPDYAAMEMELQTREIAVKEAKLQAETQAKMLDLMTKAKESEAYIGEMQARAILLLEQARNTSTEEEINAINAQIQAGKLEIDAEKMQIEKLKLMIDAIKEGKNGTGAMESLA
jgi:chaperonin GroES